MHRHLFFRELGGGGKVFFFPKNKPFLISSSKWFSYKNYFHTWFLYNIIVPPLSCCMRKWLCIHPLLKNGCQSVCKKTCTTWPHLFWKNILVESNFLHSEITFLPFIFIPCIILFELPFYTEMMILNFCNNYFHSSESKMFYFFAYFSWGQYFSKIFMIDNNMATISKNNYLFMLPQVAELIFVLRC
jgi:hypothetical protein